MTDEDKSFFRGMLSRLAAVFGRAITSELEAEYYRALQDLQPAQVELGVSHCIRHGRFWPRPGEIRQGCERAHEDRQGSHTNSPVRHCDVCEGNGWTLWECSGRGECGHAICAKIGYVHTMAARCQSCHKTA